MKYLYLFLFVFCISFSFAQDELKHCGADEMRINTLKQHPDIANAVINRDNGLEKFTSQFVAKFYNKEVNSATYIIPVVFHIIHNYGNENISNAQVLDGIDILNKTFRKQLADTASIVADFKPLHADCEIEFRLAKLDPDGNCTSGINRIASPLTTIGDHSVKSLIHWPPDKYLNIYVVSNAAGLAGHCVWPSDADTIPLWDGIVIGYNYVGSIGSSNYTTSVALAHECGHYLNLQHIWGGNNVPGFYYYPCADPNKDCNIDDLVADTPPTIGWQTCNLAGASCGNTVDNVQNAMDYSYCNRMFTYGQKARMQACLNSPVAGRNNLWQTANLIATGVLDTISHLCKAEFTSNKKVICPATPNNTVSFTNNSFNGNFTQIKWFFEGGSPDTSSAANPTISYTIPGKYDVTLKVVSDSDSVSVTIPDYITVMQSSGSAYPFSENFENINVIENNGWCLNSFDTLNQWELNNSVAFDGLQCAFLNNFDNTQSTKDELFSPIVNLSGASTLNLSFRYAFAKKDSGNTDKLQLYISNNCNSTWIQRLIIKDTALETAPATLNPFVPSDQTQWKQAAASIPTSYMNSSFRFKFVFTSNGGNNFYIDNINLDVSAGIDNLMALSNSLTIYPNPANKQLNVSFELPWQKAISLTIVNLLGQTVYQSEKNSYQEGKQNIAINVSSIKEGMYFIVVSDGENQIQRPFVISSN